VTVVCNASPLISLARVGHLSLLPALFDAVQISAEVHHEVAVAGAGRPAAQAVQTASWIRIQACPDLALLDQSPLDCLHSTSGDCHVDLLHVATVLHLGATYFLSFDVDQRELAGAEGLATKP